MADFPTGIYAPRTKANKAGVVYTPAKTTVGYAEDISKLDAEVVAVETELGENTKGAYASVKAWLDALTSAVSGIVTDFLGLSDTPASYADQAGKVVAVNAEEDALEFITPSGGGLTYVEIAPPAWSSPSVANTWENWDLSALIPADAKYADIFARYKATSASNFGVRKNGSAIVRYLLPVAVSGIVYPYLTELDAGRIVERYVGGISTRADFTVIGYWIQIALFVA